MPGAHEQPTEFVALADGRLVAGEPDDQPAPALDAFAAAVDTALQRPYRAEAVPRGGGLWALAARRLTVVAAPGLDGREAELVASPGSRVLHVDGQPRFGSVPAFEAAGRGQGEDFVLRGHRLLDDLWEVEVSVL